MERLNRLASGALFLVAVASAGLAIWDKLANVAGFQLLFLAGLGPSRLLELGVIAVIFAMAFELRELRRALSGSRS
jgi:hypothetical protein